MAGMQNVNRHARSFLVFSSFILIGFVASPAAGQASAPPAQAQAQALQAQAPAKDAVPGIRNYTKVDATLACGGALTAADAISPLKQAGYKSIVNLRAASEQGADLEGEREAAEKAGLKYSHLPFVSSAPDPTKFDEFLKIVADAENQPLMLHCASGGRASMFWAVKRVMIDGWPIDKAMSELPELAKNVNESVRTATLDYLKAHGKTRP